jgi:CheY-like chemotaxis protein
MSVSILVVDDEPDVAELFRQRFRREMRQGTYVIHCAASGTEALDRLQGEIDPTSICRVWTGYNCWPRSGSDFLICRS